MGVDLCAASHHLQEEAGLVRPAIEIIQSAPLVIQIMTYG